LWRWSRGELPIEIACVISNHPDLKSQADHFNVPFYHVPVTQQNKPAAEDSILALCQKYQIHGVILARYMQILSPKIVQAYAHRIINIHHSFLPAFVGANPYQQAYDKGVKLIGATAHYVTEELDMGPIIAQDVVRVTHRLTVDKLKELGQNIEKTVLARAIQSHAEDRIIINGNKTIVFDLH
jgi:formyltetrahydrofolate deformylase